MLEVRHEQSAAAGAGVWRGWSRDELIREPEQDRPQGLLILPLAHWLQSPSTHAVWLGPDDDVESVVPWLASLPLIALDFPSFSRWSRLSGLSAAHRFGWSGELRAIGDVLRDQLSHMRRVIRQLRCARTSRPKMP
jgi:uncharacterized protein (DUF934 family)